MDPLDFNEIFLWCMIWCIYVAILLLYFIKIRLLAKAEEQTEFTAIARLLLNKFECHIFYMSFKETSCERIKTVISGKGAEAYINTLAHTVRIEWIAEQQWFVQYIAHVWVWVCMNEFIYRNLSVVFDLQSKSKPKHRREMYVSARIIIVSELNNVHFHLYEENGCEWYVYFGPN